MTNREWLASMTNEKLSEWKKNKIDCDMCIKKGRCWPVAKCIEGMTEWLEAEHKEESE